MKSLRLATWVLVFLIQASLFTGYQAWPEQRQIFAAAGMVIPTACYALLLYQLRMFAHMPFLLRAFVACASGFFVSFVSGWVIVAALVRLGFLRSHAETYAKHLGISS
jgi:uncharacterized membrane protein